MVKDLRDVELANAMTQAWLRYMAKRDESVWADAKTALATSSPEVAFRAGYLLCSGLEDQLAAGRPDRDDFNDDARVDFDAKIIDWLETNFSDLA
jgi:hypothetical protein